MSVHPRALAIDRSVTAALDALRRGDDKAFEKACSELVPRGQTVQSVMADIRLAFEDTDAWQRNKVRLLKETRQCSE